VPHDYSGRLSDIIISHNRILVGCFDEPRMLIFEASTGREIASKDLAPAEFENGKVEGQCVSRIAVDRANNVHVIFTFGINSGSNWETVFNSSGLRITTHRNVGENSDGELAPDGNWFFDSTFEIPTGPSSGFGYGGVRKLLVTGQVSNFDNLNSLSGLQSPTATNLVQARNVQHHASLDRLIGFDSKQNLFATVWLWIPHSDRPSDYLVEWPHGRMPMKVIQEVQSNSALRFSLYSFGNRSVILAPDDKIYSLVPDQTYHPGDRTARFVITQLNW